MELDNKIAELFAVKDAKETLRDTNSVLELKKIEQQLNQHLKSKQGLKFNRVSIVNDKSYNSEKFSEVIDEELKNTFMNKKWKGLPLFMKWQLLQSYFVENNISDQAYIASVKEKLRKNTLEVSYEDQKVIKII